jgi:hypothetical protein
MASSEKNVMVVGSPSAWPISWLRWLRENRVKSGILSESVDQNAIIPIKDGASIFPKERPQPSRAGCWSGDTSR